MRALALIDLQNDFMPGGALPVPDGDAVVPLANELQERFDLVVATQDWHPPDHGSFAANHPGRQVGEVIDLNGLEQMLWPVHCVQQTSGAAFVDSLDRRRVARVFQKGVDREIDSYSGFFDNARRRSTGLGEHLRGEGIDEVYVLGLATDYCAQFSVLDAVHLGFHTFLIEDGCRGVELHPGDTDRALQAMRSAGVTIVNSADLRIER